MEGLIVWRPKELLWAGAGIVGVGVLLMAVLSMASQEAPSNLGLVDGRLRDAGGRSNCVSSVEPEESAAWVAPFAFEGDPDAAMDRLRAALDQLPRTVVLFDGGGYLHAECTTAVWRFVDDLELLLDEERSVIDVRSASRVGEF
ncbi:MAG: DUF1499 domain-containing protein, partial [Planctomycetes bacterium]|nr:DUF1499 domain-containing protein [Planctomycetota bacterium]